MEKKSHKDHGGQSSARGFEKTETSEDSDDNSLLAEKEDSHSDIDTIEEEVDMSQSEGSGDQEEEPAKPMQSKQEKEDT